MQNKINALKKNQYHSSLGSHNELMPLEPHRQQTHGRRSRMTCGTHLVIGAEGLFEATGVASLLPVYQPKIFMLLTAIITLKGCCGNLLSERMNMNCAVCLGSSCVCSDKWNSLERVVYSCINNGRRSLEVRYSPWVNPLFFSVPKVIIKDTSLVLTPANIKAYILMTLQGLEYMHQHWVLHRVRAPRRHTHPCVHMVRNVHYAMLLFFYFRI